MYRYVEVVMNLLSDRRKNHSGDAILLLKPIIWFYILLIFFLPYPPIITSLLAIASWKHVLKFYRYVSFYDISECLFSFFVDAFFCFLLLPPFFLSQI